MSPRRMPERERVLALLELIHAREPQSEFLPVPASLLAKVRKKFPGLPEHLVEVMKQVGQGSIGDSRYQICVPMQPESLYSRSRAAKLAGFVIVGDDFSGYQAAYDTRGTRWKFGEISRTGFNPDGRYEDFVEFLRGCVLKAR